MDNKVENDEMIPITTGIAAAAGRCQSESGRVRHAIARNRSGRFTSNRRQRAGRHLPGAWHNSGRWCRLRDQRNHRKLAIISCFHIHIFHNSKEIDNVRNCKIITFYSKV